MRYAVKLWQHPAGRVALAIGLSLLIHALVLFAPLIELPKSEVPLPPLTAKLEPLPRPAPAVPKKKRLPKPESAAQAPAPAQANEPETAPAESVAETPQINAEPQPPEQPVEQAAEEARPLLPKHAQLTFSVFQGDGGLKVGETKHRMDIEERQYTLKAVTQTTGIASLFKSYALTQSSEGLISAQGLLPSRFTEEKKQSNGTQSLDAKFDWETRKLHFSHGGETGLPGQAQDILSFLYQLSQMPMSNQEVLPLRISNGKKLESYELEIGSEETISTPLGKLRALPLRKLHGKGEEGLEIWLGLEYRLLPVKVRQIDRAGQVAGEMIISDIRVSDE